MTGGKLFMVKFHRTFSILKVLTNILKKNLKYFSGSYKKIFVRIFFSEALITRAVREPTTNLLRKNYLGCLCSLKWSTWSVNITHDCMKYAQKRSFVKEKEVYGSSHANWIKGCRLISFDFNVIATRHTGKSKLAI